MTRERAREMVAALPTAYREAVEILLEEDHQHVWGLIGESSYCLTCGKFGGIASIVVPDIDWGRWEQMRDRYYTIIKQALAESQGIHAETIANYLAERIAFAEVPDVEES